MENLNSETTNNQTETPIEQIPLDNELDKELNPLLINKDEIFFRGFLTLTEQDKARVLLGFLKDQQKENKETKTTFKWDIFSIGILVLGLFVVYLILKSLVSSASNGLVDNQDLKWLTDIILKLYELISKNPPIEGS